jgi:hypothetical protein
VIPLQASGSDVLARLLGNLLALAGLSLLSGLLAAVLGLGHRWYARATVPTGLSVLVGLTGVVLVLNVESALGTLIATNGTPTDVLTPEVVFVNTVVLGTSLATAVTGGRVGDRVGESLFALAGSGTVDIDVSGLV